MPKLRVSVGEIISRVETSVNEHRILDYSSHILAPLIGWRPGQLPGWPAFWSGLDQSNLRQIVTPSLPDAVRPF